MFEREERNLFRHRGLVDLAQREKQNGHRAAVIWFTGLSGSGKSTIAHAVEKLLYDRGCHAYVLDGDNVRHGLCSDLGFSKSDRQENIRRIGETAKLLMDSGLIVLAAFISPYARDRDWVRSLVGEKRYIEVYCKCPVEVCAQRDVKGLYRRASRGEIEDFTGISAPYEEPVNPDAVIDTREIDVPGASRQVVSLLCRKGVIAQKGRSLQEPPQARIGDA